MGLLVGCSRRENEDDSDFCGICGNKLENGTTNISIPDTVYCTKCGRKI